jgi:hypothetical protein
MGHPSISYPASQGPNKRRASQTQALINIDEKIMHERNTGCLLYHPRIPENIILLASFSVHREGPSQPMKTQSSDEQGHEIDFLDLHLEFKQILSCLFGQLGRLNQNLADLQLK